MSKQIIAKAAQIIGQQIGAGTHCTLSLINDQGYPTASTITASKAEGLRTVWFGTGLASNKAKRIQACDKACVCWNSEEYNISLVGRIEVVTDPQVKREMWYEGLENHFSGADDPVYCVLRFVAERCNLLVDWQEVQEAL